MDKNKYRKKKYKYNMRFYRWLKYVLSIVKGR